MTDLQSIIKPKRPSGSGWRRNSEWQCPPQLAAMGFPIEAWGHRENGLFVLSAVEVAREPGKPDLGPEYHLSVSANWQRCSSADALWVLGQFDLSDALEDNHVPSGRLRNFWRPVADQLSGFECHCVGHEPTIREDKGDFIWRGVTP